MHPYLEIYLLILSILILGLAIMIMIIIILVKEWNQWEVAQFWPRLPATGPPGLESGLTFSEESTVIDEIEARWSIDPIHIINSSQLLGSMAASY
jgi:hypothetical protein